MHNLFKLLAAIALVAMLVAPFVKDEGAADDTVDSRVGEGSRYVSQDKPDFAAITDANKKKQAFFDYLRPAVAAENLRISKERSQLKVIETAFHSDDMTSADISFAQQLGEKYASKVPDSGLTSQWFATMLMKVNLIPEALVLTQAANESAWGTSRFAREANNYFGQWCYNKGCGLVPLQRIEGASHEVAKFDSMSESVHGYFMNVNRNKAYAQLRQIRANIVASGDSILTDSAATQLTNGLLKYSERGQAYIDDLQSMIRVNQKFWKAS